MAGKTYKVGIIGAGQIVSNMHLPVLLALPDFQVAWLHDSDASRLESVSAAYRVPALRQLTGAENVDIVLVAIPYGVRRPIYEMFRGRNTSLYVEKPFARSQKEHLDFQSWFADAHIGVGFQRRYLAAASLMQQIIRSKAFGDLRRIRVEHGLRGRLGGTGHGAEFALSGGGLLFDIAIHWIDLALYLSGASRAQIDKGKMTRQEEFDIDTEARFTLTVPAGDIAFEVLATGLRDTENATTYQFAGATLKFSHTDHRITVDTPNDSLRPEINSPAYPVNALQLCHETWKAFVDTLETGHANWTSAASSLVTTQVIEQLYGLGS
jgi:predicted dehydrogenase